MEAVGIVNGSNNNHLIKLAAITANTKASTHSRAADFFFFGSVIGI
ncbi:hypothetical protein C943_00164 [Mariniradius saccharolyticus AK6]|uniref:Uncharacterized protein n=1 Tax=Mariniradius saccharolyticus AK6 TaxID=1239962 RepID=M7YE45_9BACT|nr:hypothetical protein C943_00164 [Mariniradius saccharolyticus AK6]